MAVPEYRHPANTAVIDRAFYFVLRRASAEQGADDVFIVHVHVVADLVEADAGVERPEVRRRRVGRDLTLPSEHDDDAREREELHLVLGYNRTVRR